jgi:hypothetical protein
MTYNSRVGATRCQNCRSGFANQGVGNVQCFKIAADAASASQVVANFSIDEFYPSTLPKAGNITLTVYGVKLYQMKTMSIGGQRVSFSFVSDSSGEVTGTVQADGRRRLLSSASREWIEVGESDEELPSHSRHLLQESTNLALDPYDTTIEFVAPVLNRTGYLGLEFNTDFFAVKRQDLLFYTAIACDRLLLNGECVDCPSSANCPGGGRIWPKKGYWSRSEYSLPMSCPFPDACLGVVASVAAVQANAFLTDSNGNVRAAIINPDGSRNTRLCDVGYTGLACQTCETNYYKDGVRCLSW